MKALKEAGVWKAEHEAHNQKLLKRQDDAGARPGRPISRATRPTTRTPSRKGWMARAQGRADQGRHGRRSSNSPRGAATGAAIAPALPGIRQERPVAPAADRPCVRSDGQGRVRRSARADRPGRGRGHARAQLTGFWRWLLIVATAATIFLCINQQFTLRFFVGYTQLNTEYFYLLILLHAALHVPDLPGERARAARPRALVRRGCCSSPPIAASALPDGQRAQGGRARLGVRRRADAGHRRRASSCGCC